MKRFTTILTILAASLLFVGSAAAEDFEVRPGTSNAAFTSNAPLETISGTSSSVSGMLTVTLSDATTIRGAVEIPVASLRTGVDDRDEHLQGEDWLNAAANPNIRFEVTSVALRGGAQQLTHGQTAQLTVTGTLTINGESKEVTAPAQATYYVIAGSELEGTYGIDNNLLRVVSNFSVSLSDFGISIAAPLRAKVSDQINLQIRLTAVEQ